jgi:hypothetical protein
LSTVTQTYNFRLKIDSSKFQKEEAAEWTWFLSNTELSHYFYS